MLTKLRKIGNSYGILIPKDTIELLALKEGDTIEMQLQEKNINLILTKKEASQ